MIKIISETSLQDFEFWSGAKDFAKQLTSEEFEQVESTLEELYPNGLTDTQLNDLFWFENEQICGWLGLDVEEVYAR